jgi:hypothetical protein
VVLASAGRVGTDAQVLRRSLLYRLHLLLRRSPHVFCVRSTMYTSYWHKPRYNNDRYTSYTAQNSRPDEYDAQLPVARRPRATLTRQLEYDDYVDKYISHTHYNPTGDRNVQSSSSRQYSNSAYLGNGGLNEVSCGFDCLASSCKADSCYGCVGIGMQGHARQLDKASTNNYSPLFSRNMDFYFAHNFASPAFGGLYNGGINSFLELDSTQSGASAEADSTADDVLSRTYTHSFLSSERVTYVSDAAAPRN